LSKYNKTVKFERIKDLGNQCGIDTTEFEKKLRGEDDETIQELMKEIQDEIKSHNYNKTALKLK
jgi:hypothetical protein